MATFNLENKPDSSNIVSPNDVQLIQNSGAVTKRPPAELSDLLNATNLGRFVRVNEIIEFVTFGQEYAYLTKSTSESSGGPNANYLTLSIANLPAGSYTVYTDYWFNKPSTNNDALLRPFYSINGGSNTSPYPTPFRVEFKDTTTDDYRLFTYDFTIGATSNVDLLANYGSDSLGNPTTIEHASLRIYKNA